MAVVVSGSDPTRGWCLIVWEGVADPSLSLWTFESFILSRFHLVKIVHASSCSMNFLLLRDNSWLAIVDPLKPCYYRSRGVVTFASFKMWELLIWISKVILNAVDSFITLRRLSNHLYARQHYIFRIYPLIFHSEYRTNYNLY